MEHKTISLADQVFERLEYDILTEKYKQGELLTEMRLCEELGVSRTPIREALRRLEQENLIKESGKGSIVIGITEDDLHDIFTIRLQLECIVASRAAKMRTESDIKLLKDTVELQEFYHSKNDSEQIKQLDNNFHETLYKISGSTVFYNTLLPLLKKVQKYRKISVANQNRSAKCKEEHREILNAIISGDAALAEKKMSEHISNAFKSVVKGGTI